MKPFPKLAVFLAAGILAPLASAHFKLSEPASWITENDLGDPQKLGPCGGTSANAGTVTNAVTKVQGGQKLHLKWNETVYHPGHYRIALSVNSRAELPADPPVQTKDGDKGPMSVSAAIQNPAKVPVLVDNLFPHDMRPPAGTAGCQRGKPMSYCPTSRARNALSRSSSSWPSMGSTKTVDISTTTAPICRSLPIRKRRPPIRRGLSRSKIKRLRG